MLSNVTKSADVLRGATEMQDLWVEVEKETPHAGLKGPRAMTDAIMNGYIMNEQEKRDELELTMRKMQQKNNFYSNRSGSATRPPSRTSRTTSSTMPPSSSFISQPLYLPRTRRTCLCSLCTAIQTQVTVK